MSDQEDTTIGQDEARRKAADEAYWTARSSVLKYVAATGGQVSEQPIWPGAQSTRSAAEPVAGIHAARVLADVAARVKGDYIRVARTDGIGWREIGDALGLAEKAESSGQSLAEAAYRHVAGDPDAWREASYGFTCGACQQAVTDYGPYDSHPEDNERGHADGCSRMAALVADHERRMAELDAEWEAAD